MRECNFNYIVLRIFWLWLQGDLFLWEMSVLHQPGSWMVWSTGLFSLLHLLLPSLPVGACPVYMCPVHCSEIGKGIASFLEKWKLRSRTRRGPRGSHQSLGRGEEGKKQGKREEMDEQASRMVWMKLGGRGDWSPSAVCLLCLPHWKGRPGAAQAVRMKCSCSESYGEAEVRVQGLN